WLAAEIVVGDDGTVAALPHQCNIRFPGGDHQLFFINAFLNKDGYAFLRKIAHGVYCFLNGFVIATAILGHRQIFWIRLLGSNFFNGNKPNKKKKYSFHYIFSYSVIEFFSY